ncbi:hypothetical protein P3U41_05765 [Mammaliicoccus sciuri]|uniref:hypothetical protein n=1 Tax=Mammaliicoccus sciuri TaxID=1296 RepID=UPI002B259CCC|nr:hypothetical protein [Mammaliicoccus sciuri]WQL34276.1 hypothetical protein P3U41_05765 [Mammaliicoccus sciuri]WQL61215.1 hypothetical protein P3T96_05765 [Mammaliicoccus sciuri]
MKKHFKIVSVTLLSIGILTGCQSKEEKAIQGTWEHSQGGVSLTFDNGKLEQKFSDGSGSEKDYEVKNQKKNGEFTVIESSKNSKGKNRRSEYIYKLSKNGKTLWVKNADFFYEKVEK